MNAMTRVLMVISGIAAVVVMWLVYAYDPEDAATHFPMCPFHALTGLNCPGCGSTRALHALLHGDVTRAFGFNPLFVVALPFVVAFLGHAALASFGVVRRRPLSPRTVGALLVFVVAYGVIRNVIHV